MDDGTENVENGSSFVKSPDEFITELVSWLESTETTDSALLDALKNHILKQSPAYNAVDEAAKAIWKLAEDRAIEDTGV